MGHHATALVDSGAMGNYISPTIVNRLRLPWKYKDKPYQLQDIDGNSFSYNEGIVDMEIDHLPIELQGHREETTCDLMDIHEYDLVLGYPWLRDSNPSIDWRTGQMQWSDVACPSETRIHERRVKFHDDLAVAASIRPHKRSQGTDPPPQRKEWHPTKLGQIPVDTEKDLHPGVLIPQQASNRQKIDKDRAGTLEENV